MPLVQKVTVSEHIFTGAEILDLFPLAMAKLHIAIFTCQWPTLDIVPVWAVDYIHT